MAAVISPKLRDRTSREQLMDELYAVLQKASDA